MLFLACFCSVLILCAVTDAKTMEIPPRYPLLVAACFWLNSAWQKQDSFTGFLFCGGVLFLFSCIKQGAFGGGDIKLCAAAGFWLNPMWDKWDSFAGFVLCGGILFCICLFREGAFGGGDIKLCAAVGFTLGGTPAILGLLLACLFSLPQAYFTRKKSQSHIAFAPYLAAGFSLAAFFYLQGGMFYP